MLLCSGFLDNVCTDIIHYHNRQLRRFKGNLSEFVKAVPTAKSYYELEAATLKFRFPTPGLLDGITSKEKPIAKLSNVTFSYPGAAKPQLTDVNVAARLSSRVAVIGVNGAGKSVSSSRGGRRWAFSLHWVLAGVLVVSNGRHTLNTRTQPML